MTGEDSAKIDALLAFDGRGLLPPGDHLMTLGGLRRSVLVEGPPGRESWNRVWRGWLLDRFATLVGQLWGVGVERIYLAGSFVTDKDHPGDLDGYFECDRAAYKARSLHRALNDLGPFQEWTWREEHRRPSRDGHPKLPLWHHHRVELFPHYGQTRTGFFDEQGNDVDLPTMFRRDTRTNETRGIVRVVAPNHR